MSYLGTKPQTATEVADGVVTPSDLSTGHPTWNSSNYLGVGVSPSTNLDVSGTARYTFNVSNAYTLQTSINAAGSSFADDYKNAAQHIWQTSGTERMRIDSSGRVTTPYQPALVAVVTSSKTINSSTNLSFDSISLNRGSQIAVSISNSRFTVPIAGYYKVDLSWFLVSSGNDSAVDLKVNGSTLYRIGSNIGGVSGTAAYLGSSGGAILNLAANDYIEICGSGTKTILGSSPVHSLMCMSLIG